MHISLYKKLQKRPLWILFYMQSFSRQELHLIRVNKFESPLPMPKIWIWWKTPKRFEKVIIKIHFCIDPHDKKVGSPLFEQTWTHFTNGCFFVKLVKLVWNWLSGSWKFIQKLSLNLHHFRCLSPVRNRNSLEQILPKDDLRKVCCNWSCISCISKECANCRWQRQTTDSFCTEKFKWAN